MEDILPLLQRGFAGGIVTAAVFAGFAGFLYLAYRLIKFMRPQEIRQEEQRVLSHRFYKVSGRGRAAYIILCLEAALPDEIVELLLTKQRGSSLGAPFDGLRLSCLVKKECGR